MLSKSDVELSSRVRGQSFMALSTEAIEEFKLEEILQGKFDDGR